MKIAFLDPTALDYTTDTPYRAPLGGTESAACYLAAELAALGHEVVIINCTSTPGIYRGVRCLHHKQSLHASFLNQFDIAVVLSSPAASFLRGQLGVRIPLVLWNTLSHDQPAIAQLASPDEQALWAGFAFVSHWQLDNFASKFGIPRDRSRVMRNAMSPAFATQSPPAPWYTRNAPPVLVYTSTPFRGLDVLLTSFPKIRSAIPDARLRVFSSMAIYHVPADQDQFRALYTKCATTDGVDYVGPLGQDQLARELSGAAALAYPSTFAETSCIAVIEAMAAGATIFTSRLGALPETTAGFAEMIEPLADHQQLAQSFADLVVWGLDAMRRDAQAASVRRDQQIAFARAHYLWPARAAEWVSWLSTILASAG
jgi:glycosyltransferase involved in cell wall biosynthesis